MNDDIYLIGEDGRIVEMSATAYESEALLQKLVADYPSLLAGRQAEDETRRRWLLVSREAGVQSEENGANRWSIDHVFLDQDGIPTLVEVKRSSDSRIRREVVGQLLNYAANAVVYWTDEDVRARLLARCGAQGLDADGEVERLLGPDGDPDAFWSSVRTNLRAGKVRLLFVADTVPAELRRIVEFLNVQMDPAEVLALEVKQYVGEGWKTLVPRVIGQTAEAEGRKSALAGEQRHWDEASFFQSLAQRGGSDAVLAAQRIIGWVRSNAPTVRLWWGRGKRTGSFGGAMTTMAEEYYLFAAYSYGRLEIYFQWLKTKPPFDDEGKRRDLLGRLNAIAGVDLADDAIHRRPGIGLALLAEAGRMEQFLAVLDWIVKELRDWQPPQIAEGPS
jgi:hypothetical protein